MDQRAQEELQKHLAHLPGWTFDGRALIREYHFPDFRTALAFVNTIADLAEITGQHPEIRIAGSRVTFACSNRITKKVLLPDIQLARQIQNAADSQDALAG
ncbi:MAG: 4a-hydroxytetrahydrobiopterin dehydratase [candidate division NC10 bacterium]|nr:4a-hydroxytetrahydrobiopterin dehydratase [candidate division NC10 bacterium]